MSFETLNNIIDPGAKYIFFPTSSTKTLINRSLKAIKKIKTERFDCDIALFGCPEYVLFLKDVQDDFMEIDTYMYSRFFNTKGYKYRNVDYWYKKMHHESMMNMVPMMGLYGFDMGLYTISNLAKDGIIDEQTPFYDGIQTNIKFHRVNNWSGLINNTLEIIHFTPTHSIQSIAR